MEFSFNERFTLLVDDMNGEKYTDNLQTIADATGVSVKTLRKYYLAERDADYKKDAENSNRITSPKENIDKLALFFKCTPEYLLGESDIADKEVFDFISIHSEYGLTEDMLLALKEINQSEHRSVYYHAFDSLFRNYKRDEVDAEPYQLLYLLGKYLAPLSNQVESVLPPDIISDLKKASGSVREITDIVKDLLLNTTIMKKVDTSHYLTDIQTELKYIRSKLDIIQGVLINHVLENTDGALSSDLTNGLSIDYEVLDTPINE